MIHPTTEPSRMMTATVGYYCRPFCELVVCGIYMPRCVQSILREILIIENNERVCI